MLHLFYHIPPKNASEAEVTIRLLNSFPPAFHPALSPNLAAPKRYQRVAARWLLRELFLRKNGNPEAVEVFRLSSGGKPFVPGTFEFSLAHTDGLIAAAGATSGWTWSASGPWPPPTSAPFSTPTN